MHRTLNLNWRPVVTAEHHASLNNQDLTHISQLPCVNVFFHSDSPYVSGLQLTCARHASYISTPPGGSSALPIARDRRHDSVGAAARC